MNLNIDIPEAFGFLWETKARFKILKGGAGSGKSESAIRYGISRFMSERGCNIIVARKVATTLKKSVFAAFQKLIYNNEYDAHPGINAGKYFKINKSDMTIKCLLNGNLMFFIGMDDTEKIKSVTAENGGIELILMEEMNEFEKADLDQLNTRLRGNTGIKKEIIGMFNPISEDHWIKIEFWDKKSYPDCYLSETNYIDNPFIDDDYKKTLESYKNNDPYHYDVYCLGKWGSVGEYDTIIPYPIIYKALQNKIENPVGGLDLGVDPARFGDDEVVIYIRRGHKILNKRVINKKEKEKVTDKQMGKYIAKQIITLFSDYRKEVEKVRIKIDIGAGDATAEALYAMRLKNVDIFEIKFGGKPKDPDKYYDCVTEMYFEAAELIPELELIQGDQDLFSELSRRKFDYDSKVRKRIEPKKKFKERILRSPDNADAFVLCLYEPGLENQKILISEYW